METNLFFTYLDQKNKLPKESSAYLKEVTHNFPYFQAANILYAKSLFEQNDIRFENELRRTAISVFSRKKLYDYIHFQPEKYFITTENEGTPAEETNKITAKPEATPTETKEKTVETQTPEAAEPKEEPKNDNKEKDADPLEKQYLSEAINIGYLDTLEEIAEQPTIEPTKKEKSAKTPTRPELIGKPTIQPNPETFTQWVSFFDTGKIGKETNEKIPVKSIDELIAKVEERKNTPIKKVPFFSAEKMARKSVTEDENLVTETLANIYYQQENYEKALKAYEKLSLKYPNKKVYFAAQIKLIKKKLNN